MRTLLFFLLIGFAASVFAQSELLDEYYPEVKEAYIASFDQLHFPPGSEDKYRATAGGMLIGCLHQCMTDGAQLHAAIAKGKCNAMCECTVNGLMTVSGTEFTLPQQSPPVQAKGVQITKDCIAKHKR